MMKTSNKIIIFVSLFIIFQFSTLVSPIYAGTKPDTVSTVASKDSYVRQYSPTSNYGGQDYFLLGRDVWDAAVESFFYFNFSDKPSSWTKAEISLRIYSIPETTNVTVYLVEESWEELTITWNNKPSKGEVVTSFLAAAETVYKIDVTSYIAGRTNISICLWTPEVWSYNQLQGTSEEGYYSWMPESAPQLIWTYPETTGVTVTNPISSTRCLQGSLEFITWTTEGPIDEVDIHFLKEGVIRYQLLRTANDGSYLWTIPEDIEIGTDWQIQVRDSDDTTTSDTSDNFEIYSLSSALPPGIPGYPVVFVITSIIVMSVVWLKKKRKTLKT